MVWRQSPKPTDQISSLRRKTIRPPSGDTAGSLPSVIWLATPSRGAIQMAWSTPWGRLAGFGLSRPVSKSPPRTKIDRAAVGGPGKLRDLLAVVIAKVGEPAARVSGRLGDPHIASAMFIEHPCDGSALGSSSEGGWERSAHHLFEGEEMRRMRQDTRRESRVSCGRA